MASVGPQIYPRRSPQHHRFQVPVPFLPLPLAFTLHADVTLPLMCSGLMVVGHRLDRYSLLSVVFAVFHGHSRHGSLAQDILSLFTLISRCACLSNSASLCILLVRTSLIVVSLQSLPRTALNVSLLRYIAFVFRLFVCVVPSHGGHGHVSKGVKGKSRRRYIRTNILHPHPPSPSPNIPTLPRLFPCRLAHRLPSIMLRIAYLYRCL